MLSADSFVATLQEWLALSMHRSMCSLILYCKGSDLSMSQLGALLHVFRRGTAAISDIGERLGITSAAASQMLERLVQQGLVDRSESPRDRRVKQIALTDRGRRVLHECIHARQNWVADLAAALTPAEQEQVRAALALLIEKVRQSEKELPLQC